jgi:hypothetical protein
MGQKKEERELQDLVKNTRIGHPIDENIDTIFSLHLNSGKLTIEQIEKIKQKATYISVNRRNMEEHNREQIKQQHSANNPIARILATTSSRGKQYHGRAQYMINESTVESFLKYLLRG